MKYMNKLKGLSLAIAITIFSTNTIFAQPTYNDVPSTHWAYSSIAKIADRGLIIGDTAGNFKPNDSIDKFETAKILAKIAGYKQSNYTDAEKAYFDKAYEKNKSLLSLYSKKFVRWNSSADREIAYLIEKEILTVEDLNQFVILKNDNSEALRALSREEIAIFLVKLMGRKSEAISTDYTSFFQDDKDITTSAKPYIYYLKSLGVIAGDTSNKFNPNSAVTKAGFAIMLDKTLAIMEGTSANNTTTNPTLPTNTDTQNATKIETITGTFDKLFNSSTTNALQIIAPDGVKKIYKISPNITIYIDGFLKTTNDLKEGMQIIGVLNNYEITDLKAQSNSSISGINNPISMEPTTNVPLSTLEGTVSSLSTDLVTKTIGIEIRMLNPKGEIISDTKSFALSEDCKITKGDTTITFMDIVKGDVVKAEVSGAKVYSLKIEQKNRSISGILLEKKYVSGTNTPILVVEDKNNVKIDLRVTENTSITRKGIGQVSWNELRIGDSFEAYTEYDNLIEFDAWGTRNTVDGIIEEIFITKNSASITLKESHSTNKYALITGTVDVYSLRIGSTVRLRLDSREVETLSVLQDASTTSTVTGYISNIKRNSIIVNDNYGSYSSSREIFFDDSTIFMDSITGNKISVGNLKEDMKIYAVIKNTSSNLAYTITVLSK